MYKTCFLFGHADTPQSILPAIEDAVEKHYSIYGIQHFYVGNRGNFDNIAAKAVRNVKQKYPDVRLFLVLAYHPAEREPDMWGGYDNSYYPPIEGTPRPYAIVKANQHMVDTVDSIICFVRHFGNTRNLLEYAQRRQKRDGVTIENLAEDNYIWLFVGAPIYKKTMISINIYKVLFGCSKSLCTLLHKFINCCFRVLRHCNFSLYYVSFYPSISKAINSPFSL